MTIYYHKHEEKLEEGVCSRNIDLKKESDDNGTINSYYEIAIREKLQEKLQEVGLNIALQGELVGCKINGNIYELTDRNFWLFDIYDIDKKTYYTPEERQDFAKKYNIKHVPVLHNNFQLTLTIDELINFAEGKSVLNKKTEREGLVFKNMKNDAKVNSFKVISNKYLLKHQ
jgi:ATP-dependent RNA circularization protein (DNA/RNA ligase family)